jgi:hypothetical protein
MIGTNAHTTKGIAVLRGPSLREWLVLHLGESAARVHADEPDGIVCAVQTLAEVNGPDPQHRDPGATSARWVRLA